MTKHRLAALWFILCTLLSIFNICTIFIFDGFDWPFYAVVANVVVSLIGIFFHIHADEKRAAKSRPWLIVGHILLLLNSLPVTPPLTREMA